MDIIINAKKKSREKKKRKSIYVNVVIAYIQKTICTFFKEGSLLTFFFYQMKRKQFESGL